MIYSRSYERIQPKAPLPLRVQSVGSWSSYVSKLDPDVDIFGQNFPCNTLHKIRNITYYSCLLKQLVDTSRVMRPMYGRGRYFRGATRGQRGARGAMNNRWNTQQQAAKPMQVLSKAQKNKERSVRAETIKQLLARWLITNKSP